MVAAGAAPPRPLVAISRKLTIMFAPRLPEDRFPLRWKRVADARSLGHLPGHCRPAHMHPPAPSVHEIMRGRGARKSKWSCAQSGADSIKRAFHFNEPPATGHEARRPVV